jgi:CheY-like chemotaxis protein/two-component sensor histidine kinase
MLGHELRNPLAAITAAVAVIEKTGGAGHPAADTATGIIRRQSRHLARLLDDLLDVGRVMTGKILLDRLNVDLAVIARRAVAAIQATRSQCQQIELALTPTWVHADQSRMEQIVTNLLTNACKYTPLDGRITVSVASESGHAVLRVADTGLGLEPDLLPRVFDLFVQGRRTLDRADGGLGIGLTLVRRLVELHGGSVAARSEGTGKGSEFEVRLPEIAAPEEAEGAGAPTQSTPRDVLVVEDNADAREMLKTLLALAGHRVHEASDGPSGVRLALESRPDVALIDIGLPGFDGYEVASRIRAALDGTIRLVALTGYGLPEDERRAKDAGFDDHVVKPIDEATLGRLLG